MKTSGDSSNVALQRTKRHNEDVKSDAGLWCPLFVLCCLNIPAQRGSVCVWGGMSGYLHPSLPMWTTDPLTK